MRTRLTMLLAALALGCSSEAAQDPPPAGRGTTTSTAAPRPDVEPASPAGKSRFLRFRETGDDEGLLEAGVTTYTDAKGRTVTLYSAVHIADAAHYERLQVEFEQYDALLYELIAEPDDRPKKGRRDGGLGSVQRWLAGGFELQFQLDGIDYTPANFVHADLTPKQFRALQTERGESFVQLVIRAMQAQVAAQSRGDAAGNPQAPDLVSAFRSGYGRHTMRMAFATQIEEIERVAAGFAGEDGESVLVEGRNARAMEVLDEQLAAGKSKLAIYYGGAHMPDFEERLVAAGFEKTDERWLTAWDCHKRKDKKRKS